MQHNTLTHSRNKLPKISLSSILLISKYKVSMTWRPFLAHNVRVAKCKTLDNIHSKVVLRFELKPLDSESNVLFKLKRLLLFPLNILDSRCACIRTTLIHRKKFGKETMKLESSKEISHRISARFAEQAYSSRLINELPLSWLSNIRGRAPPYFSQCLLQEFKYDIFLRGVPWMGIYFLKTAWEFTLQRFYSDWNSSS